MFNEMLAMSSGGGTEHELNVIIKRGSSTLSQSFDVPSDVSQLIVIGETYGITTPSVNVSNATSELLHSNNGDAGYIARKIYRVIPTDSTINISLSGGIAGTEAALTIIY